MLRSELPVIEGEMEDMVVDMQQSIYIILSKVTKAIISLYDQDDIDIVQSYNGLTSNFVHKDTKSTIAIVEFEIPQILAYNSVHKVLKIKVSLNATMTKYCYDNNITFELKEK